MGKGMVMINKKNKSIKEYRKGNLTLNSRSNPEIKDWAVGEEYEVTVKVRQKSVREVDEWDKEEYGFKATDVTADFEIVSVESAGMPKAKMGMTITKGRY
jgi:hypothetical protein